MPRDDIRGPWAALYVTMNPHGHIVMSRVTYEKLGEPAAFNILFDEVNNRIGLKPTVAAARDAYKPVKVTRHGARRVSVFRLMQDYRIELPQTIRFHDADIDHDGILVLDLRTARVSERSLGHYRRRQKLAEQPK